MMQVCHVTNWDVLAAYASYIEMTILKITTDNIHLGTKF